MAISEHPGKKVITLGKAILVINVIVFTTAGGLLGMHIDRSNTGQGFGIGGFIGLGVGYIIGWLSSIILVAFGELVENSTVIREKLCPDDDGDNDISDET